MSGKCTGLTGRLFGHKWSEYTTPASKDIAILFRVVFFDRAEDIPNVGFVCHRCGATKETHDEQLD